LEKAQGEGAAMDPSDWSGFCEIFMTNPSTRLKPVVF
jgi:hypothetical protein